MTIIYLSLMFLYVIRTGESQCNINLYDPVNNDDIQFIVNLHNQLRSNVAQGYVQNQPQASNMLQFNWDSNLAQEAQDWANGCYYAHNRPTDSKYLAVGQNIALYQANYDLNKNFTAPITDWFNEVINPGYPSSIPNFPTQYNGNYPFIFADGTGHYTQIAWANTSSVGCGYSKYIPSNTTVYNNAVFYVCNYGPAGNYDGSNIYEIGSPASNCPYSSSPSTNYNGLCKYPDPPQPGLISFLCG